MWYSCIPYIFCLFLLINGITHELLPYTLFNCNAYLWNKLLIFIKVEIFWLVFHWLKASLIKLLNYSHVDFSLSHFWPDIFALLTFFVIFTFVSDSIVLAAHSYVFTFRYEIQLSECSFKPLEDMGRSFLSTCGRVAFGIMFSLYWIMLLAWYVSQH